MSSAISFLRYSLVLLQDMTIVVDHYMQYMPSLMPRGWTLRPPALSKLGCGHAQKVGVFALRGLGDDTLQGTCFLFMCVRSLVGGVGFEPAKTWIVG
jgi:hypothetical protein